MTIALLLLLSIPGALMFVWLVERFGKWVADKTIGPVCDHMFPERGIGCNVCDQYYWETGARDMRLIDDRIARLEEMVFPLEPNRRIWIEEARGEADNANH